MILKYLTQYILILLFALLFNSCADNRHSFELFLEELTVQPAAHKQKLVQEVVKNNTWPLAENEIAYFVVQDTALGEVFLTGDMCAWQPDSLKMEHIPETNYYFKKMHFPGDARIEYKYVLNGNHILDALNPYTGEGGYGKNSALCMPKYVYEKMSLLQQGNYLSTIDTLKFKSRLLKNERNIYIYRHPQTESSSPIIIFHDGSDYLRFGSAQIILDNLIATEDIPPMYAMFIDPVDRQKEYWMDDAYLKSVFYEMVPEVKRRYGLSSESTLGMGGVSLGGLITLYALKNYSDELDFVFSQSGALWVDSSRVITELNSLDSLSAKVYFDYGTFENMAMVHEQFFELMDKNKMHFKMNIFNEGHNWANWRAHLPLALTFGLKGNEE